MPSAAGPDPLPLMGLRSLRISATPMHRPHRSCDSLSSAANSSTDSSDTDDRCDSSLGEGFYKPIAQYVSVMVFLVSDSTYFYDATLLKN